MFEVCYFENFWVRFIITVEQSTKPPTKPATKIAIHMLHQPNVTLNKRFAKKKWGFGPLTNFFSIMKNFIEPNITNLSI